MNGDFSLYTKQKAKEIYQRWNQNKATRPAANKPAPAPGGEQGAPKKQTFQKPFNKPQQQQQRNKPQQPQGGDQQKPYRKPEEPAQPVNEDMLQMLANKFKKS
jgi:DNA polymerase-3 subunit epsilon